jgi:hypothetical protein
MLAAKTNKVRGGYVTVRLISRWPWNSLTCTNHLNF